MTYHQIRRSVTEAITMKNGVITFCAVYPFSGFYLLRNLPYETNASLEITRQDQQD
jgi:hypothetical protein